MSVRMGYLHLKIMKGENVSRDGKGESHRRFSGLYLNQEAETVYSEGVLVNGEGMKSGKEKHCCERRPLHLI